MKKFQVFTLGTKLITPILALIALCRVISVNAGTSYTNPWTVSNRPELGVTQAWVLDSDIVELINSTPQSLVWYNSLDDLKNADNPVDGIIAYDAERDQFYVKPDIARTEDDNIVSYPEDDITTYITTDEAKMEWWGDVDDGSYLTAEGSTSTWKTLEEASGSGAEISVTAPDFIIHNPTHDGEVSLSVDDEGNLMVNGKVILTEGYVPPKMISLFSLVVMITVFMCVLSAAIISYLALRDWQERQRNFVLNSKKIELQELEMSDHLIQHYGNDL